MLKIKKVSEVLGKQVYTSDGDYFGQIEEVNLIDNKVGGWKIRISGGFMNILGGARGVVIPHQFVKSIGDVFVVNSSAFKSMPAASGNAVDVSSPVSEGDTIDLA